MLNYTLCHFGYGYCMSQLTGASNFVGQTIPRPETVRNAIQNVQHKIQMLWCTNYFTPTSLKQSKVNKLQMQLKN